MDAYYKVMNAKLEESCDTKYMEWRNNQCPGCFGKPPVCTEAMKTAWEANVKASLPLHEKLQECREPRKLKKFGKHIGVNFEKPDSKNGEISVNYDWEKVMQYEKKWDDWFRHESREPATQEIA